MIFIKQKHPSAEIVCIAPERCREILEAHPAVSGFFAFDEKGSHRSALRRLGFILELRKLGPWDEGYLFHRSRSRAAMLFFAGVKQRIGYCKGRKLFLTTAVTEPSGKPHQLDYFMALMQGAGYAIPAQPQSRFYFKPEDEAKAREILNANGLPAGAKYICFHLGANWEPKRWPPEHFALLADKIAERWKLPVVVTGSAQDRPLFEAFIMGVKKAKVIEVVGKTGLRVSAAIYQKAACLVTGDSGPMHIASGVGARVIALFGPTDPKLTGPRGTGESLVLQYVPTGYSVPFFGKDLPSAGWLCHITPDQVMDAVERMLRK